MDTDALTSTTYRREVQTLESAGFVVIPPERAAGTKAVLEAAEEWGAADGALLADARAGRPYDYDKGARYQKARDALRKALKGEGRE